MAKKKTAKKAGKKTNGLKKFQSFVKKKTKAKALKVKKAASALEKVRKVLAAARKVAIKQFKRKK